MDSIRQPVFAIQLENIERENFDRSLAKHQIYQYSPIKILHYTVIKRWMVGSETLCSLRDILLVR